MIFSYKIFDYKFNIFIKRSKFLVGDWAQSLFDDYKYSNYLLFIFFTLNLYIKKEQYGKIWKKKELIGTGIYEKIFKKKLNNKFFEWNVKNKIERLYFIKRNFWIK